MDYRQRHLAIQIRYRERRLEELPIISIFERKNNKSTSVKLRVFRPDKSYYTVGAMTERGKELYPQALARRKFKSELVSLHRKWNAHYSSPVPSLEALTHTFRHSPLMPSDNFDKALPYQNHRYPLTPENGIMYNNNLYRTKGEVRIAMILCALES